MVRGGRPLAGLTPARQPFCPPGLSCSSSTTAPTSHTAQRELGWPGASEPGSGTVVRDSALGWSGSSPRAGSRRPRPRPDLTRSVPARGAGGRIASRVSPPFGVTAGLSLPLRRRYDARVVRPSAPRDLGARQPSPAWEPPRASFTLAVSASTAVRVLVSPASSCSSRADKAPLKRPASPHGRLGARCMSQGGC